MVRKFILFALSMGFFIAAIGSAGSLYHEAVATNDHDDLYAAIFMGGMLGFVGLVLLILVFRKHEPADPAAASATIWGIGMSTLGDNDGGNSNG